MPSAMSTRPSFGHYQSFAGHPTWYAERGEVLATFSDSGNDFEIRSDVDRLRRLGAISGGLAIARAIEKPVTAKVPS